MSETKPHIAKAFANGAVFGACALTLVGMASVFAGAPILWFEFSSVAGFMKAAAIGTIGFGTLGAASNVIVHTIPGLATLLGEEHTGYQSNSLQRESARENTVKDVDLDYLKDAERDLYVGDYLRAQHDVHDIEHHDRVIDEAIEMEEAMRQSIR